jgi:hypothetical protein
MFHEFIDQARPLLINLDYTDYSQKSKTMKKHQ